jgi:hypothetical protein
LHLPPQSPALWQQYRLQAHHQEELGLLRQYPVIHKRKRYVERSNIAKARIWKNPEFRLNPFRPTGPVECDLPLTQWLNIPVSSSDMIQAGHFDLLTGKMRSELLGYAGPRECSYSEGWHPGERFCVLNARHPGDVNLK